MPHTPDFSKAVKTYRQNALVQKHMADSLAALVLKYFGCDFNKIFEIGSGTGFLSENITQSFKYEKLILNDLTDNYTGVEDAVFIKGDATKISLPDKCDLIISGACFQWFFEIESFLKKLKKSFLPEGILAFSSFGQENFKQFKKINNIGLNYIDYKKALGVAGYEILQYEQEINTVYFASPREVLRHVRATGVTLKNDAKWTKERLKTFEDKYVSEFGDKNGVELTYNPLYIIARIK